MPLKELCIGLRHSETTVVAESMTVPALFPIFGNGQDMPSVFATALMVGFMEWTCVEALKPYLKPNDRTVGTRIDVSHCAPTPVGLTITADVELVEMRGHRLIFNVACRDDFETIGEARHERALVDGPSFSGRAMSKLVRLSGHS